MPYLIGSAFTLACFGLLISYWVWRFDRKFRTQAARSERAAVEDRARFETARVAWEKEAAGSRDQSAAVVTKVEASVAGIAQLRPTYDREQTPPEPEPQQPAP
jgi:hypothetical protein